MRFLHAPLHGPETRGHAAAIVSRIKHFRPHSVGLTEAYAITSALQGVRGYRLVLEEGGEDQRRGQKDCPMLVKDSLASYGSGQFFGAPKSTPIEIAPDRWTSFSVTHTDGLGTVLHFHLHPHAAVQDELGHPRLALDRTKKFIEEMDLFDGMLTFAQFLKWRIVVTGDLNYRDEGPAWLHSPYAIMRKHGLAIEAAHLDVMASTPSLKMTVEHVTGVSTDHPWLLGTTH